MNWREYLELSEKTLSTQFNCKDEKEQKLLHAVIGVLTEVEELLDNHIGEVQDFTNMVEECGDLCWYLAIIGREYQLDYPQIIVRSKNEEPMKLVLKIIKNTCKLLDMLKKKIYYNKQIDENLFKTITNLVMLDLSDYMNTYDIDIEKSFDINIEKLKARYGDKFSSERAINRDLETERNILEGNN
jgi:NTP pyrophosphatase (non-canonical NTP hydrolase)